MSQDFLAILDYMEKEKGINRQSMISAIETALLTASRKSFGPAKDLRVELNPKNGQIRAFATLKAVEKVVIPYEEIALVKARAKKPETKLGDYVEVEVTPSDFGRIAAQVFKQTMNQNIRTIERTMIFDEFKDRAGDIVTGTVRRFERSDVVIDLGKFEAIMPGKERVPTEEYTPNERIRALVLAVENTMRGPEIVLSRSHPDFVRRLFELEVNELHDKTIEIKGLAREAGYRTKIAVWSKDEKVDPVGACVGMRGARVKNIVRELNNEKIDLFKWSPNVRELAIEALKPAKLKSLELDETNKRIKVWVDKENLSLAIGRRGQNARLTAKLTGWEIDIQEEVVEVVGFEQKLEQAVQKLSDLLHIDHDTAQAVVKAGILNLETLSEVSDEDLKEALPDLTDETLSQIRRKAQEASEGSKS